MLILSLWIYCVLLYWYTLCNFCVEKKKKNSISLVFSETLLHSKSDLSTPLIFPRYPFREVLLIYCLHLRDFILFVTILIINLRFSHISSTSTLLYLTDSFLMSPVPLLLSNTLSVASPNRLLIVRLYYCTRTNLISLSSETGTQLLPDNKFIFPLPSDKFSDKYTGSILLNTLNLPTTPLSTTFHLNIYHSHYLNIHHDRLTSFNSFYFRSSYVWTTLPDLTQKECYIYNFGVTLT